MVIIIFMNPTEHCWTHAEAMMYPTRFIEVVMARPNRWAGGRWPRANWRRVARFGLRFVGPHMRATSDDDKSYM